MTTSQSSPELGGIHADLRPLENDPRLVNKLMKKRQEELERRTKLFDTRRFRKGVSHAVLAGQLAEKKAAADALKAEDAYHDHYRVISDQVAQVCETIRSEATRERHKAVMAYSLENCRKEQRREYALSDPNMLKNDLPARIGDNDPRLGPSSIQYFEGEESLAQKRKQETAQSMQEWLAHQCAEKKAAQDEEKESDRLYDEATKTANEVRGICEVQNAEEIIAIKKQEAAENKLIAEAHRLRKQAAMEKERRSKQAHVDNERNSERLLELHDYKLGVDGRLMKAEFRRLSHAEKQDVHNTNAQQVLMKIQRARSEADLARSESQTGIKADLVVNYLADEKARQSRARRLEAEEFNKELAAKKKAFDKTERKGYRSFTHVEPYDFS